MAMHARSHSFWKSPRHGRRVPCLVEPGRAAELPVEDERAVRPTPRLPPASTATRLVACRRPLLRRAAASARVRSGASYAPFCFVFEITGRLIMRIGGLLAVPAKTARDASRPAERAVVRRQAGGERASQRDPGLMIGVT